jgi:hypothetical protein
MIIDQGVKVVVQLQDQVRACKLMTTTDSAPAEHIVSTIFDLITS